MLISPKFINVSQGLFTHA